jgi:hypothetical protein
MHDFDIDAERIKLERLLGADEGSLAYLNSTHSSVVRAFREDFSDALYRRHQDNYARLAKLSRVLPVGASAKLAETVLGSVLGAGVAGEMDPDRAGKLAGKLSAAFLAKLSVHLEPHRASKIIGKIPQAVIVAVAQELVKKKEYITLARFVTAIDSQTLRAVMDAIPSSDALLRVGIFVEQRENLSDLLEQLSDQRRSEILAAATAADLWPQMLVLLTHLNDKMKGVMGDAVVALGADLMALILETCREHKLWEPLILTVANMSVQNRRSVLALSMLHDAEMLTSLFDDIHGESLWPLFARLWTDASEQTLSASFNVLAENGEWLAGLLRAAMSAGLQEEARQELNGLPAPLLARLEAVAKEYCAEDFAALMTTAK